MSTRKRLGVVGAVCMVCTLWALASVARADGRATDAYLDESRARWEQVARQIWDTPELGLNETRSSAALIAILEKEGFKVTRGIGGEATAFVATAGSGAPVVALLAEYDALPGPVAGRGSGQEAGGRRGHARARLRPQPARHRQRRRGDRRQPRADREEAPRDDPAVRHAGRGDPVRQDLHDPRRRVQADRRRARLAPRRSEPRHQPDPARRRPPSTSSSSAGRRTPPRRPGSAAARSMRWCCSITRSR